MRASAQTRRTRSGWSSRRCPPDDLQSTVFDIAHLIAANAPLSVAASKSAIDQVLLDPAARDMEALARMSAICSTAKTIAKVGRRSWKSASPNSKAADAPLAHGGWASMPGTADRLYTWISVSSRSS